MLICPPWGWDEISAHRSLKRWSERLGARGYPTLRVDLPGTGNSSGGPFDAGTLDSWLRAIEVSVGWLRESTGVPRITLLGIGLGGLLAREVLDRGGVIDELVLWGSPRDGRSFVRQLRAFSGIQTWSGDAALPGNALEAGGFFLSAETKTALAKLSPGPPPPGSLQRALLLDRDGVGIDAAVGGGLEAAGAEVTIAAGPGYATMVSYPQHSQVSLQVAATVEGWLAGHHTKPVGSESAADARQPAREEDGLSVDVDGVTVRETAWLLEQPFGRIFGVLAEPTCSPSEQICAVFLNAGAIRHVGPNRMWTEAARRWAARGVPALRVDLEAIGESDGDETRFEDVGEFYVPGYARQVVVVLDELERQGLGPQFLLAGICSGGYWSFTAALGESRVRTALLLNPGALTWNSAMVADREFRQLSRLLRWTWWRKLFAGEIRRDGWRVLNDLVRRKLTASARRLRAGGKGSSPPEVDRLFDLLRAADTRLVLAFSGSEPLEAELRAGGLLRHLDRWPNIELVSLPDDDHTLRPPRAQTAAHELLDNELALIVDAKSGTSRLDGLEPRSR